MRDGKLYGASILVSVSVHKVAGGGAIGVVVGPPDRDGAPRSMIGRHKLVAAPTVREPKVVALLEEEGYRLEPPRVWDAMDGDRGVVMTTIGAYHGPL